MLIPFQEYIKKKELFHPEERVLLAVSGGVDSMVLLHLFESSSFHYGVVHCNFQLRGIDSAGDESFVSREVMSYGVDFFSRQFETEEFARINGISIEMAARQLRYNYFEEVRNANGYDFIATAHHQDDLVETFFLNLSRKTGLRGLAGIREKTGRIIRPMLFASRKEINDYAQKHFIAFREDYTNHEIVYQRNFIRHQILPLFSELNPAFGKNMAETVQNLRSAEEVYLAGIDEAKNGVLERRENSSAISIPRLLQSAFPKTVLFEILSDFNFNPAVIDQIYDGLERPSGKRYFSKSHRLVKDREVLFITPLPGQDEHIYYVEEADIELFDPMHLTIEKLNADDFLLDPSSLIAFLDREMLEFPLLIRKWQKGDYFQPLGMTGFKKLSDFFIDEKIPVHEKENVWLLCSGRKIVWVMGNRIDNRFKITRKTKQILKISIV